MKRKREDIFYPLSTDQDLNNCSHNTRKNKPNSERASSGRTSIETVLSPQTSYDMLMKGSLLCQSFSPIPKKSFSLPRSKHREETDSDNDYNSDCDSSLEKDNISDDGLAVSSYGYFTNPHTETQPHIQPAGSAELLCTSPKKEDNLSSNICPVIIPRPRKAETVFDFTELLKTLSEEKDPAAKKRIT